ncbi:unnamed protein product [Nezara viridula]|uniref:Uncharacterized protein n=1 Tax=Nezara viridula TaxID=85310 RepID=A0A9P0MQB5_NEZVI|nr:unnamed protein product [Nezara viridula]
MTSESDVAITNGNLVSSSKVTDEGQSTSSPPPIPVKSCKCLDKTQVKIISKRPLLITLRWIFLFLFWTIWIIVFSMVVIIFALAPRKKTK